MTKREEFEQALRELNIDEFYSLELNEGGDGYGYKDISTKILFAGFRIGMESAKAQTAPDGYRLMPPEPTPEMVKAWRESPFSTDPDENFASGYDAIFLAAPEKPK